jgi:hypothetical protein
VPEENDTDCVDKQLQHDLATRETQYRFELGNSSNVYNCIFVSKGTDDTAGPEKLPVVDNGNILSER